MSSKSSHQETPEYTFGPVTRSNVSILAFQLRGLSDALNSTVPHGLEPGDLTVQLLRKYRVDFYRIVSGVPTEGIPEIPDNPCPVDLLVISEAMKASLVAFLSPEEVEQQSRIFGFIQK